MEFCIYNSFIIRLTRYKLDDCDLIKLCFKFARAAVSNQPNTFITLGYDGNPVRGCNYLVDL